MTLLIAEIKDEDISQIALNAPEKILKIQLDLEGDTTPEQVHAVMDFLKLKPKSAKSLEVFINGLHRAFVDNDATMIEVNPAGVMKTGK